jgi:hypothetical protein
MERRVVSQRRKAGQRLVSVAPRVIVGQLDFLGKLVSPFTAFFSHFWSLRCTRTEYGELSTGSGAPHTGTETGGWAGRSWCCSALGGVGRYGDVDNHGARRAVTTKGDRCSGCAAVAALGRRSLDLALVFTGP